jgi:hypothetical protein
VVARDKEDAYRDTGDQAAGDLLRHLRDDARVAALTGTVSKRQMLMWQLVADDLARGQQV